MLDRGYRTRVAELMGRHHGFKRLMAGQALSYVNAEVWYIAMPFLLLSMSRDPVWMGAIAAAGYLPNLLAGVPAGWCVDRCSPRRVILASAAARAVLCLVLAAVAMSGRLTPPVLAAGCFLLASLAVAHSTAKRTWIAGLVPAHRTALANSVDEGTLGCAEMLGALGGGFAIAALGPCAALVLQAALLAACAAAVARIDDEPRPVSRRAAPAFGEGFRYLLRDKRASRILLRSLWASSAMYACCMAFFSIQVFYYGTALALDSEAVGWVIFAISAIGAAGGFLAERAVERLGLWNAAILSAAAVPAGLFLSAVSMQPVAVILAAGLILAGGKALSVIRTTVCQSLVPKPLLGRVQGVYHALVEGMTPVVSLGAGAMAQAAGFPAMFVAAGVIGTACCILLLAARVPPPAAPMLADAPTV